MRVPESVETADQILLCLPIGQGPFGNRRNDRERVLHAVAELCRQHLLLLLGRNEVCHIDKSKQHAIDLIIRRAVWEDAGKEIAASAQVADGALGHLLAGTYAAHILLQVRIIDAADNIG